VCVWGVGVGSGWSGFGGGLGRARGEMEDKSPAPFLNSEPQKPGREGAYPRCRHVSCRCAKMGVGEGGKGRVPGRAAPRVALSKQYSSSCLGDGKTGERVGLGAWGFPVYSCVYSGVFSVWYPLWVSTCVRTSPSPCPA
uniref:Uncharacterized protein n=2 Tax=Canis lupus TaxID=9612 RepID=A0A8C0N8X0_CANLF